MKERKINPSDSDVVCNGTISRLCNFILQLPNRRTDSASCQRRSVKSLNVPTDIIWQAEAIFIDQPKDCSSHEEMVTDNPRKENLHFVQKSFDGEFEFDIPFFPDPVFKAMTSDFLTEDMHDVLSIFTERFRLLCSPQTLF